MIAALILYAFLLYFVTWSIYILVKARLSPLAKIPGYSLYNPVLGNLWSLNQKDIFQRWDYSYKTFGTIYRWYTVMGNTFITITSPEYVKQVLVSKNYVRGSLAGVEVFRKIVGSHSMLLIDGDAHRRHRSIVSPAFRIGNLRKLIPTMHQCSLRLCDYIDSMMKSENRSQLESVDIRIHLSHATLTVIGLAGFGFDFDCIDKRNQLAEILASLNGSQSKHGLLGMLPYSYYYPLPAARHFWSCLWTVHSIIDGLIKSKRQSKNEKNEKYREKDLLDMILEHTDEDVKDQSNIDPNKALTERELRDEVMTFIMAGHETSSLALTWSIAMLCLHENWQDKCRREILDAIGEDREITWDHLERLKVTKAVINETLRMWPPIPAVSRRATTDDQLGPYKIPAQTNVIVLSGQMHRLPEYWSRPLEFLPERFLDEGDVPWDAFLPFGDGAHKCIGYQFALAEIMTMLATLLKKYRFRLAMNWDDLKVQGFITLQPVTPILVDIIPI